MPLQLAWYAVAHTSHGLVTDDTAGADDTDDTVGWFQFETIVSSAAMNLPMHRFLQGVHIAWNATSSALGQWVKGPSCWLLGGYFYTNTQCSIYCSSQGMEELPEITAGLDQLSQI